MKMLAHILIWLSGFALGAYLVYAVLHECILDNIDLHVATYGLLYCLLFLAIGFFLLRRSRSASRGA